MRSDICVFSGGVFIDVPRNLRNSMSRATFNIRANLIESLQHLLEYTIYRLEAAR